MLAETLRHSFASQGKRSRRVNVFPFPLVDYAARHALLLILTLFISNCKIAFTQDSSKEASFELLNPNCAMNSAIRFLPLQENYKFGNKIILNYKNYSQNQIAFSPDSGVKILTYEEKDLQWVELKNRMQYSSSPEPYVIVGPANESSSYHTVVIYPDTLNNPSAEMRAVVVGHIYQNNKESDECVGAFIDIQP